MMHLLKIKSKIISSSLKNNASNTMLISVPRAEKKTVLNNAFSALGPGSKKSNGQSMNNEDQPNIIKMLMKSLAYTAGAAFLYHKTANEFFLSTTSLHDHKQGFTSDCRLQQAEEIADDYYHAYHDSIQLGIDPKIGPSLLPKLCGENLFLTMLDFRAATKVHIKHLIDTRQSRDSIVMNISCIKGERIKLDLPKKHGVVQAPVDFDITKSADYDATNKYSLSGVINPETGSYGYASRSICNPFIEKGADHHSRMLSSDQAITPKACLDALQNLLCQDEGLTPQTQFLAGQALLVCRPLYCSAANWGDAHHVLKSFLEDKGLASPKENQKLGATRPFTQSDLEKGLARRNTSIAGPFFHEMNMFMQKSIYNKDELSINDLKSKKLREIKYTPISHVKINDDCSSFEDSSGMGDSFTGYNVTAYINHARLLSGEDRLSKNDVIVIVGCLNAIYDNASSERHSLKETARGCFVGAGYTVADADAFYQKLCNTAALEFYGGKSLHSSSALGQ